MTNAVRPVHATFNNTAATGTPEADLRLLYAGDHYNGDPVFYVVLGTSERLDATSRLFMGYAAKRTKLERIRTDYTEFQPSVPWTEHRLTPLPTASRRIVRNAVTGRHHFRSGDAQNAYLVERRYPDDSSRCYWIRNVRQEPGLPLRPFTTENQVTITWGGSPRFLDLTWRSAYQG